MRWAPSQSSSCDSAHAPPPCFSLMELGDCAAGASGRRRLVDRQAGHGHLQGPHPPRLVLLRPARRRHRRLNHRAVAIDRVAPRRLLPAARRAGVSLGRAGAGRRTKRPLVTLSKLSIRKYGLASLSRIGSCSSLLAYNRRNSYIPLVVTEWHTHKRIC